MIGRRIYYVHFLHEKYGTVVRISPYQVAISDPDGFVAIHRIESGFLKSPWYEEFVGDSGVGVGVFATADPVKHAVMRKLFSRAFSATSLRQNCEVVVREKVAKAVQKIKGQALHGSVDLLHWLMLMTWDVVGQLCFGESFELLESGKPDLQARLEAEVAAVDEIHLFNDAFLEKLPLLNAVIDETLHLYSSIPSNLPRVVPPNGGKLGGHDIPGGLEVETQAYTLHRDGNVFPNPLEFDESRWIGPAVLTPCQKSSFCPFGAGARICIGQHLARMELRMGAAVLFNKCPGLKLSSSTTDAMMEMGNFFVVAPIGHRCDVNLQ
ncbi:cytochrome P450 [Colletotrichum salicis]|uniref:Cytochrome P450 n=1 Tax=Colletotrichum salicis TaxID=1209931 RepID=A0A135V7E1_9PEZI|nr:cytochrome P450 [Colletotrichum salicis]